MADAGAPVSHYTHNAIVMSCPLLYQKVELDTQQCKLSTDIDLEPVFSE